MIHSKSSLAIFQAFILIEIFIWLAKELRRILKCFGLELRVYKDYYEEIYLINSSHSSSSFIKVVDF